jgi:hypothetical protein
LNQELSGIFKAKIAGAFHWPYYAGAVAALLSIPLSLMTGRRVGQHRAGEGSGSRHQTEERI